MSIPLTLQVGESRRRDHDDDEVTEPVEDSRNGVRVDTSTQVRELSGQQPGHSQPSVRKLANCIRPQVWLYP